MACLRVSLSPVARMVYKYSPDLSKADLKKPYSVVNALREYYGASAGVSGEWQKFLSIGYCNKKNESTTSWETRIRKQGAQCKDFVDELMRELFIASLTSDANNMFKLLAVPGWTPVRQHIPAPRGTQLPKAGSLQTACFTCVKIVWRTKYKTVGTFVIQWDVNKWPCIL